MRVVEKVWGSEHIYVNNDKYCGKVLNLYRSAHCSMHYHKKKLETFLVIEGRVLLELEGVFAEILPFQSIDIPVGAKHRFTGLEKSKIVEFSTHHEDEDSYRTNASGFCESQQFQELLEKYGR